MNKEKDRILAVDDAPENLRLIEHMLKREGYEVFTSSNGPSALQAARMHLPDLILLDIVMPEMDGYEVCRRLKADESLRRIPVIFVSALNETLDKVKAFSLGGVDFITVPFSLEEALARVRTHLKIGNLQNRLAKQNAELCSINEKLQREMEQRKRAEKEIAEYQKKLKRLFPVMTMSEEKERSEIAVELHDKIGQQLALLKIKLGALKETAYENGVLDIYDDVFNLAQEAIHTTRSLMFEISPIMLYELGFEPTIEWLLERFQEKYGIEVYLEKDDQVKPLDERSMFQLFRTTRELMFNVVKHSRAKSVKVTISRDNNKLKMSVEDDGVGFDFTNYQETSTENERFGLFSIKERLSDLGGGMEIDSAPGRGVRIRLHAPLSIS